MRLLFLLFPVFLCTCDPAPATTDLTHEPPWINASFLKPLPIKITVINQSDTAWQLKAEILEYHDSFNESLPDSLAARESVTFTADISRPRELFVGIGTHRALLTVLPGFPRKLSYDGTDLRESGEQLATYDYIDRALTPLKPMPFYPPEITSIAVYHDTVSNRFATHLDTLSAPGDLPPWVKELVVREAQLLSFTRPLLTRSYRQYFLQDTLMVPDEYIDSVRKVLASRLAYQSANFNDLFGVYARYLGESGLHREAPIATRNYWATTESLLNEYPAPEYRNDATAELVSTQISDRRMYGDKAQIIDTLTLSLPTAYQEKIAAFTTKIASQWKSDEGMQAFLQTPLEDGSGNLITPLAIRTQPSTLYKFWFAGCYPCITQQPHERELLAKYPDLEIVYVAYSTAKEDWLPYLQEHDAPASANLYVPVGQTELLRDALGQLGAPTYLLLDTVGKVVCSSCPKPSDPAFETML